MLFDPKWAPPEIEITLEPWQKILLDAADILEKKGWVRSHYHHAGRSCAIGAIAIATSGNANGTHIGTVAGKTAVGELMDYIGNIPYWNDHVAKDGKEVIATLRAVATKG